MAPKRTLESNSKPATVKDGLRTSESYPMMNKIWWKAIRVYETGVNLEVRLLCARRLMSDKSTRLMFSLCTNKLPIRLWTDKMRSLFWQKLSSTPVLLSNTAV